MVHVKFCLEICLEQHIKACFFIFKHPAEASSWGMKAMQQMSLLDGVRVVKFAFCMLGMKTKDGNGNGAPAMKRAKVMTNSTSVAVLPQEGQC